MYGMGGGPRPPRERRTMLDEVASVEVVEAELTRFADKRAAAVGEDRPGQQAANELERMWAESDRRFQVRRRLELAREWFDWHMHLAETFRKRSAAHEAKARAFLEMEDETVERMGA